MYVYKNVMLYTLSILQFCQLELKNLKKKKKKIGGTRCLIVLMIVSD